jgi:hypothetical protein
MIHGLLWLPLLGVFSWLAWAGWNEYQKLEAYKQWAEQFEHAKYDIYAALGQNGQAIAWGKPTRQGIIDLQEFSLSAVQAIRVIAGAQAVDLNQPPNTAKHVAIEFQFADHTAQIPFTDLALAIQWAKHLQHDQQQLTQAV